jgi:hypothetical protein
MDWCSSYQSFEISKMNKVEGFYSFLMSASSVGAGDIVVITNQTE